MIGIFANMHTSGGSETRAATLASSFRQAGWHVKLMAAHGISEKIRPHIVEGVEVVEEALTKPLEFKQVTKLVIILSDCKPLTTKAFWDEHGIGLNSIQTIVYVCNFLVSPTINIPSLGHRDVRIAVTNNRFLNEVSNQDRYLPVRHLPRALLLSPINPDHCVAPKVESSVLRLGRHSKAYPTKWNRDLVEVVKQVNATHGDRVAWDFMGVVQEGIDALKDQPNVTIRKEYSTPVKTYLSNLDVCVYMPGWKHQEPWARSTAEAMASGCPLITTDADGGNRDQVLHGNNGFLCKDVRGFVQSILFLVEHPEIRQAMARNCQLYAKRYTPEKVLNSLLEFMS